jgi:hypothetical protein
MEAPTLIYCAGKNRRFDEIALGAGYKLGAQLPTTVYYPIYFADQDWKKPNRARYIAALAEHRPFMASVLDWEREEQLPEVLAWAEDAAPYVETVMIIPKVQGGVNRLPRIIGGKPVRLGYSVPTKYGGTQLHVAEFAGWPVHLLGGSPQAQMNLLHYLGVSSADGNMSNRMATTRCQYWVNGNAAGGHDRYWPQLSGWGKDAPYEAFRRSCENIKAAWFKLCV